MSESTTVDSCNGENGVVEMKVTLRGYTGTYDGIDASGQGTFGVDKLTQKFEGDYLILEKVFGGDECTKMQVDGTEVCSAVAEKITVQCKYSLLDQTLDEASFQVSGQDTESSAENTGTLKYNMEVDNDKNIGQEITFKITPVNPGLVYATIKSCDVVKGAPIAKYFGSYEFFSIRHGSKWSAAKFQSDDVIMGSTGVK